MMLSLSLLVLLVPVLLVSTVLGSRPGECKREKDAYLTRDCTVDEDCKDPDKKCCPTPFGGTVCRQPAQTCSKLDCGPNATCNQSSISWLPFCDDCNPNQCQNGGTCKDGVDSHSCTCPDGFTGDNCEITCALTNPAPCEKPFEQETAAGGWTVFQRRCNGCVLFNRTWAEYKAGFGYPGEEIWLGLDNLRAMTSQQTSELRVDLQLFNGKKGFAVYSNFSVGPSAGNYMLNFAAMTSGNLDNALQDNNGLPFSTDGDCAELLNSGWWFSRCGKVSLNGPYSTEAKCPEILCPIWVGFDRTYGDPVFDSIKTVELRFRPMSP